MSAAAILYEVVELRLSLDVADYKEASLIRVRAVSLFTRLVLESRSRTFTLNEDLAVQMRAQMRATKRTSAHVD